MDSLDMAGHLIRRLHQLSTQVFVQRTQAAGFDLTPQWQATLGWRMLTGGVDNDTTYNFATFQTITAGVAYRF